MAKVATSFRLSEEAVGLLKELSERLGVSQASVVEMSLRRMAEHEAVGHPGRSLGARPTDAERPPPGEAREQAIEREPRTRAAARGQAAPGTTAYLE